VLYVKVSKLEILLFVVMKAGKLLKRFVAAGDGTAHNLATIELFCHCKPFIERDSSEF
jgi:hypothetical protein